MNMWGLLSAMEGASKSLLSELNTDGCPRGSSFAPPTTSLSPTISPDSATTSTGEEFLFNIDCPPSPDILNEQLLTVPYTS
jgi:hypothetical protein